MAFLAAVQTPTFHAHRYLAHSVSSCESIARPVGAGMFCYALSACSPISIKWTFAPGPYDGGYLLYCFHRLVSLRPVCSVSKYSDASKLTSMAQEPTKYTAIPAASSGSSSYITTNARSASAVANASSTQQVSNVSTSTIPISLSRPYTSLTSLNGMHCSHPRRLVLIYLGTMDLDVLGAGTQFSNLSTKANASER